MKNRLITTPCNHDGSVSYVAWNQPWIVCSLCTPSFVLHKNFSRLNIQTFCINMFFFWIFNKGKNFRVLKFQTKSCVMVAVVHIPCLQELLFLIRLIPVFPICLICVKFITFDASQLLLKNICNLQKSFNCFYKILSYLQGVDREQLNISYHLTLIFILLIMSCKKM